MSKQRFLVLAGRAISIALMISVASLGSAQAEQDVELPSAKLQMPVSINALMVTLIDHSAHYIWDYARDTQYMGDTQWQAIEYYAVQLAAAAPLITLGGTGTADNVWAQSEQWTLYAGDMMVAAETALNAARLHDDILLDTAGDLLIQACVGCHDAFKPTLPTEGLVHDPYYDDLYHLFLADPLRE